MLAFKGFNKNLQATMGKGIFQFEPGKTYEESECKCAHNGLHCAENPLCAMDYYSGMDDRYFMVSAGGDINQDGYNSRISCTKLTLVKELDRIQMAAHACLYLQKYPDRVENNRYLVKDKGLCHKKNDFIIVRGKNPVSAGVKGSYLFLVKECRDSGDIEAIYPVHIDGKEYKSNKWYCIRKGEVCEKKN